jgi:hypothetical protein
MATPISEIAFNPNTDLAPGVPLPSTTTTSGTGTSPGNGVPPQPGKSSEGAPAPGIINTYRIKEKLLRPSLTSHFQCWFNPPGPVRNSQAGQYYLDGGELISLLCSEASLPGSSIITNEINDDYSGVTERPGYRRQYDDRSDFTFYVDHGRQNGSYNVIMFFEEWIRYAMGETNYAPDADYHYRVNFPDGETGEFGTGYRTNIFMTKFERDFVGNYLEYVFVQAYPISITSMPVSYDSSELLKCTVSFTYNRYIVTRKQNSSQSEPGPQIPPGIPRNPIFDNPEATAQNVIDTTGQFGQTGFNLNQNPLGTNPGQINPGSGGRVS